MLLFVGLFWSLKFHIPTRLVLASTKPTPHARHIVCEPHRIRLDQTAAVETSTNGVQNADQPAHGNTRQTVSYAVTGKLENFLSMNSTYHLI